MVPHPRLAGLFLVIKLAITTLVAFLIADITSILITHQFEVPVSRTVETVSSTALNKEEHRSPPNPDIVLASILQSGVFRRPALEAGFPSTSGLNSRGADELLKVRLIGTVVGDPSHTFAIVENLPTKEQSLYRLNDWILGVAQVVAIERNRIQVKHGQSLESWELTLEETISPQPASGQALTELGQRRRLFLDRREVNAGFENLATLMTKARVYPHVTADERTDGFVIRDIVPGSLFERIGLRNNDILRRINGVEVKDPETLFKMIIALKDETSISLDLVRGSRPETFAYEIH